MIYITKAGIIKAGRCRNGLSELADSKTVACRPSERRQSSPERSPVPITTILATGRLISMITGTVTILRPKMDEKHIHYLVL